MHSLVLPVSFEDAQGEWDRILPDCFTNTVFVTPWWQRTWLRHFGDGSEPRILSVRDGDTTLGIAPMLSRDGVLGFVGSTEVCDYTDFLVTKGNQAAFYTALFDCLESTDWHTIELKSVPEGSPTLSHVPAVARERGHEVALQREDVAPVTELPSSWDGYLAGLSKKGRHELRRKLRRLEGAGLARQYVCESAEAALDGMPDFFRLLRASAPEKAEFMTPEKERFFVDAAGELVARGALRLAFLELDGVRVASCLSFDYGDGHLLYNSGYDPAYSSLSVGFLNKALAIRHAIEEGKREFDFLRGDERYKYDLGGLDRAVYSLAVRR